MPARIRVVTCGIVLTLLFSGCGIVQQSTGSPNTLVTSKDNETPVKTQVANVTENKSVDSTKNKERIIIYETKVDIDSDGKPEKLVLDMAKEEYDRYKRASDKTLYDYSRLLIYKMNDRNEELVFDSVTAGITEFEGERISKEEFIRITDDDKNGIPEIYLQERMVVGGSRLAIIEKQNDVYQLLFFEELNYFKYKDFDNDGTLELYGCTEFGGQIRFNPALYTAFKRKDNKYMPSYSCTKLLINDKIQEAKVEFSKEPDTRTAEYIISLCLLGGYRDQLKSFLIDNKDYLIKQKFFIPYYQDSELEDPDTLAKKMQLAKPRKRDWLESLKKYSL